MPLDDDLYCSFWSQHGFHTCPCDDLRPQQGDSRSSRSAHGIFSLPSLDSSQLLELLNRLSSFRMALGGQESSSQATTLPQVDSVIIGQLMT